MTVATKTKPQIATMNAVHDLPVLAARDLGFFKDEGLDIEFITTPGMAQVTTKHFVKFDTVFDRPRLRPEHGRERLSVEVVAGRLAASRVRFDQNAHAPLLRHADPRLHYACRRDLAVAHSLEALQHWADICTFHVLRLEEAFHHL